MERILGKNGGPTTYILSQQEATTLVEEDALSGEDMQAARQSSEVKTGGQGGANPIIVYNITVEERYRTDLEQLFRDCNLEWHDIGQTPRSSN